MNYGRLSPGASAIMRAMLGGSTGQRGPINPMSYDHERQTDPLMGMGAKLMRGTGNPNGTVSGAVRDVGEGVVGAILTGMGLSNYNKLEDEANSQWNKVLFGDPAEVRAATQTPEAFAGPTQSGVSLDRAMSGGGGLAGMYQRAQSFGGDLSPKVQQQLGMYKLYDELGAPEREMQREQLDEERRRWDAKHDLELQDLDLRRKNLANSAGGSFQLVTIPDPVTGAPVPFMMNTRTGRGTPFVPEGQTPPASGTGGNVTGPMGTPEGTPATSPPRRLSGFERLQQAYDTYLAPLLAKRGTPSTARTELSEALSGIDPNNPVIRRLPENMQAQLQQQPVRDGFQPGMVVDGDGNATQLPPGTPWGKQEKRFIGGKEYYGQSTPNNRFFKVGGEVPPSPTDRKAAAEADKLQQSQTREQQTFMHNYQTASLAFDAAEKALVGKFENALFRTGASKIPGTTSYDLKENLETLKALFSLDRLAELKKASPTGASGMGSLSNEEGRKLAAVYGSLDIGQSREQLQRNLANARTIYNDMLRSWGYEIPGKQIPGKETPGEWEDIN